MKQWEHKENTTRLQVVGETCWLSNRKPLERIFVSFKKPCGALWVKFAMFFLAISSNTIIDLNTNVKADALFLSLSKYDTILTAHRETSVFSNYLQTSELYHLNVNCLILLVPSNIKKSQDFKAVKIAADNFVTSINYYVTSYADERSLITFQDKLPENERNYSNALFRYKIEAFTVVLDIIVTSYKHWFNKSTLDLIQGLSCLDARSFHILSKKVQPDYIILQLVEALKSFYKNLTTEMLQSEILDLTKHWDMIRGGRIEDYDVSYTWRPKFWWQWWWRNQ